MMAAKWVVGDGQLFSNVNAAYNDSCERRLPDRMSFGGAGTEPSDAPERPTLFDASLEFLAFIVSTPPGDPGRYATEPRRWWR